MEISQLVKIAGEYSERNGFHRADTTFGDRIALIHSEASEALEAFRDTGDTTGWYDQTRAYGNGPAKPEGVPSELADILIRVADLAWVEGVDLEGAVEEKVAYNATRPFRHGKAAL